MGIPNLIGQYRDGLFRRKVEVISTASTGFNPDFEDSGKLFTLGAATTMFIRLPRISSKHLGINYEFFLTSQSSAADVNIVTNLDSSARIHGVGTSGSTGAEAQSVRPDTTAFSAWCRLTAVSTVVWIFEHNGDAAVANSSGEGTTLTVGDWSTGTTST